MHNDKKRVKILIQYNANVNAQGYQKKTPLHLGSTR